MLPRPAALEPSPPTVRPRDGGAAQRGDVLRAAFAAADEEAAAAEAAAAVEVEAAIVAAAEAAAAEAAAARVAAAAAEAAAAEAMAEAAAEAAEAAAPGDAEALLALRRQPTATILEESARLQRSLLEMSVEGSGVRLLRRSSAVLGLAERGTKQLVAKRTKVLVLHCWREAPR